MVKLGFIVEGDTEKIILEKSDFFDHLRLKGLDFVPEVINAKGNGNLLPDNIEAFTKTHENNGASHIIILTDLDNDKCITSTKRRIAPQPQPNYIITIAIKTIEAWFLADTAAMRKFLNTENFLYETPDDAVEPFEEIKRIRQDVNNRGVNNKPILANLMIKSGFSIVEAANRSASAKYFIEKIVALS